MTFSLHNFILRNEARLLGSIADLLEGQRLRSAKVRLRGIHAAIPCSLINSRKSTFLRLWSINTYNTQLKKASVYRHAIAQGESLTVPMLRGRLRQADILPPRHRTALQRSPCAGGPWEPLRTAANCGGGPW